MAHLRLRLLSLLLPLLAAAILPGQNIDRHELASGLTVITCELANSHAVEVRVVVRAGTIHEEEFLGSGVSRLLQRMVAAGAHDPEAAAIIRRLGNGLRTEFTPEGAVYAIKTTDTQLDAALALMAQLVGNPALTEEDFARAREQQLADIDAAAKDWQAIQDRLIAATVYARHPARLPGDGRREEFTALTVAEPTAFHRRRYRAATTTVIVTGNIGAAGVHRQVDAAFTDYPRGSNPLPVEVDEPPQFMSRARRRELPFIGNHRHAYAWRTTAFEQRDRLILDLVAIMLGNPELIDLEQRLQNRLLVTDFEVFHRVAPQRPGYFVIRYSPAAKRNVEAWQEVAATLQDLRTTGPSEGVLAAAKREWRRNYQLTKLNTSALAADLDDWELAAVDPAFRNQMPATVNTITLDDVKRVVDRFLKENGRNKNVIVLDPPDDERPPSVLPIPVSDARPDKIDFDNSAVLLKRKMPSLGLAFLRVSIGGGPAVETPEQLGATTILADLLSRGPADPETPNEVDRARAFRRFLADYGMEFSVEATRHSLELVVTCFPKDVDKALDLMVRTIKTPALPQAELERLVQNARATTAVIGSGAWDEVLRTRVRETIFAGHYAAHPVAGTEESLAGLDRDDLLALHRRLVVGANMVFSIYGQYDGNSFDDRLASMLGSDPAIPVGAKAAIAGSPWPADLELKTIGLTSEIDHRGLAIVWRAPSLDDGANHQPAMDLLSAVLVGADGQGGRIGQRLGKRYTMRLLAERYRDRGIWGLLVQAPPDEYDAVIKEVRSQVAGLTRQLADPSDETGRQRLVAEIDNARVLCVNRHLLADEDQRTAAARHSGVLLLGRDLDSWLGYDEEIRRTDLPRLAAVAAAHLTEPVLVVQFSARKAPPPEPAPPAEP